MNNEKKQIQEELVGWAKETVDVYNLIAKDFKLGYYTQTPLSLVSQSPDMLILGINPGSGGGKVYMTADELLKGNPCFEGLDKEGVVKAMREARDDNKKRNGWALWHRLNDMLEKSPNNKNLLKYFDNFVLSNMIFFGTDHENEIPKIDKEKCAERTLKLIDKLKPKVVVLLGKQSRDLYNRITDKEILEVLVPNSIYHCMYDKSHILAIKHTAYHYSYQEMVVVGKTIGFVLDHHEEAINKETIFSSYIKDDIILFEERQKNNKSKKKTNESTNTKLTNEGNIKFGNKIKETELFKLFKTMISLNGSDSCELFYRGKLLNYEYYTKALANGEYKNSKDTIAIDFLIEGGEYIIRVGTRRNNVEIAKKVAIAIDGEFRPGNTDVTKSYWHVHIKKPLDTSNDEMVRIMNELLAKVKAYRDKSFPLR